MVTKFGTGVDMGNISDEFAGQGHRSKVKVTGSDLSEQISSLSLWYDVMTSHDIMGSRHDVI